MKRSSPSPRWEVAEISGYPKAPIPLCITAEALDELLRTVGSLPAETGAKFFGPKDCFGTDISEFDIQGSADAGHAVYSPDTKWGTERQQHHLNLPEPNMRIWTGDCHRHPGMSGYPSQKSGKGLGDLGYVEEVFLANPWMQWFQMPILAGSDNGPVRIFPWIVRRGKDGEPPVLLVGEFRVCPASEFPPREFNPAWEATVTPPTLPVKKNELVITMADHAALLQRYRKRMEGVVSPAFHQMSILLAGVGASSLLATKLARHSPHRLVLCDHDVCEIENLCRTDYTFSDAEAGALKVDAVASRVKAINPTVMVETLPRKIDSLTLAERRKLMLGINLIIAGTDDFSAQATCNELSVTFGVPAVFIGIHAAGAGGRIIWHIPEKTGCYRCAAPERYTAMNNGDSDTLRLPAAPGALVDCQFIDMVALKICIALLERGQKSRMGAFYQKMGRRNEVVCRTDPDYEWGGQLWDAVLSDLPTAPRPYAKEIREEVLFAMDTIWLRAPHDPRCPVCGNPHGKT